MSSQLEALAAPPWDLGDKRDANSFPFQQRLVGWRDEAGTGQVANLCLVDPAQESPPPIHLTGGRDSHNHSGSEWNHQVHLLTGGRNGLAVQFGLLRAGEELHMGKTTIKQLSLSHMSLGNTRLSGLPQGAGIHLYVAPILCVEH